MDLQVQEHSKELRSQNQWVHIVLEASKSADAKGDVLKICGFVYPLHSLGLMMTWCRKKMAVSTRYILRSMLNLHKKSWMDSAVFMMISRLINSIAFYIVHSTKVFYCLPRKYGKYSLRNRWDTAQFPTAFLNKNHVLHCRGHIILGSLHDTVPSTLRAFV